ncbi:MAG: HEAT repeat domain-containing protein [Polyangiaceae bacterium]|nr:HEAT repeat domain-containing protein [Polyangiaceae bacterium]
MRLRALALILGVTAGAHAQKPKPVVAHAPAGDRQPALSLGFAPDQSLRAAVCAASPCTLDAALDLELPADARALATRAKLAVVRIAPARRLVTVEIPDPTRSRIWHAVVAAPLDGSGKPKLLFRGWAGLIEGEPGLRRGPMVQRGDPNADGTWSIVLGEQREDLSLCGRPAILSPKLVAPDLSLKPAKVQRLGSAERESAVRVTARALADDAPRASYRLLRATAATSAVGDPAALTDGKPETTWAENRGGDGRGEFVRMDAPSQLPIHGFELVLRPPGPAPDKGVAPAELWLATHDRVIHVTLPDDAWKQPGARFEIALDAPIKGDCLALVTERAAGGGADARVTFAELTAKTEFDQNTVDSLVGALAGGGQRAEAAADALRALGAAAVEPIQKAFDTLDEGGRRVALAVIDQSPCAAGVPLYLRALTGPFPAQRRHGRDRLRRCGSDAADALESALGRAPPRLRPLLASELSLVAPDRAVRLVVPMLPAADAPGRRLLRKALGWATRDPKAAGEVKRLLADGSLPQLSTLDLLRALGDRAPAFVPESSAALLRVAGPGADFRTRYLALGPAAALSERDAGARSLLARAIVSDPSPHVRAEAARRVPRVEKFQPELVKALADPEVRVREAALENLTKPAGTFAVGAATGLLSSDRWPMIRAAAAVALAKYGASAAADGALAKALGDESPKVRGPAAIALGERRASAHAEAIRDRLEDRDEVVDVRVSAALALGLMCDGESVDVLTQLALALGDPGASPEARALGPVALGALSRIRPADLPKRLRRLTQEGSPLAVRRAAEAALASPPTCGARTRGRN